MKKWLLKRLKSEALQPIWEHAHHYAKIGMNFWGGCNVEESGEVHALQYARDKMGHGPHLIFDVGANVGQFAEAASRVFSEGRKRILSFEPAQTSFAQHQSVIRLKNLTDVEAVSIGFSRQSERLTLHAPDPGSGVGSFYRLKAPLAPYREEYAEEIDLVTLDSYCLDGGVDRIDYLKVDVEGHEYDVLAGGTRMLRNRKVRFIQFEFGESHIEARRYFRDFHDLLSGDYVLYRILPNGLRRIGAYTTDLEIFNTINYLAELKT